MSVSVNRHEDGRVRLAGGRELVGRVGAAVGVTLTGVRLAGAALSERPTAPKGVDGGRCERCAKVKVAGMLMCL